MRHASTPLRKRLDRLDGEAWTACLAGLSDAQLRDLLRRRAAASPDLARELRATGGGWVLDGEEARQHAD